MKLLKKIGKYLVIAVLALATAYLGFMIYEKSGLEKELRSRTDIKTSDGIQSLEKWTINGNEQWVSIRGQNKNNPIILMVHGGPGSADISLARHVDSTTEKYFVVIRWDQRNAGKSYTFLSSTGDLKLETYLADLHSLVQETKKKFGRKKIFLAGHSWGSILSAITASRNPDDFYAYIGIGQFVHARENEEYSYKFTLGEAEKDGNQKAIRELKEIGKPPFDGLRKLGVEREWLGYYGGALFHGEHRKDTYDYIGKMMLSSPEYSLVDILRFFAGVGTSLYKVWPQVDKVDLYTQVKEIKIPVYILSGRFDYNTPWEVAQKYFHVLKAPKKKFIWFEKSAHAPNFEEPETFGNALKTIRDDTVL